MEPNSIVSSGRWIVWSRTRRINTSRSAIVDRVVTVVETLAGSVIQIADAQRLADEKIAGLAQRMDELARAQKHSDERVDRVIDVVEDVIRRQGPPPPVQ